MPNSSYERDPMIPGNGPDDRWCECEHPLSWHSDVDGRCKAPVGIDFEYDCSCNKFVEAQGDTLESLGVDVL